jgi:hypothetical protein
MSQPSSVDFNEKSIESEVFRFVSVRNPQRITKTQLNRMAVPYDAGTASGFYGYLQAALADPVNGSDEARLAACKALANSYRSSSDWIADAAALHAMSPTLEGLYDWLQANFNTLTIASVTAKLGGIEALPTAQRNQVWDNLLAQLILGGGGPTRAALMETLVLNNLLLNYANEALVSNDAELRILVNARVLLPEGIFPLPGTNVAIPKVEASKPSDFSAEMGKLVQRIEQFAKAIEELEDALDFMVELRLGKPIDPKLEPQVIDASTPITDTSYRLSDDLIESMSSESQALIIELKLEKGMRISFCIQALEKKQAKLYGELFPQIQLAERTIAVGGALWRSAERGEEAAFESCDNKGVPAIENPDDYDGFYHQDSKCRIKPLGIGDLLKVRQKLCCYAPGEVAHIENIMQGEYKERATRRLRRSEDTYTTSTDKETTNERDTITTEQYQMEKATSTVIQNDMSFEAGVTVTSHFGQTNLMLNSDFATSSSSNTSASQASSYARSVSDRALSRVIERSHTERITKLIDEYEETNKHGMDNRLGTGHVVGLYRWTDKIYDTWVENYGKRLMFEFMIPEPGAFHLWAMSKPSALTTVDLVEPIDPRTAAVSRFGYGLSPLIEIGVYRTNYYYWGAAYGLTLDPPPASRVTVTATRHEPDVNNTTKFSRAYSDIKIPANYKAVTARVSVAMKETQLTAYPLGWVLIQVGAAQPIKFVLSGQYSFSLSGEIDTVSVSAIGSSPHFAFNIVIECDVVPEYVTAWQKECFGKILEAYFQKKDTYDQALAEAKSGYGNGIIGTNPAINREIEQMELKKGCLNAMYYGADFYTNAIRFTEDGTDCDPPQTVVDCCTIYGGERAKFLEQAFDWQNMTYLFYPYFHGQKCRWRKLYQLQDADPLFLKFLQAGMARVVVPARLGFEEAAMHFLRTGEIWGGGPVPGIKSELYLSIVDELYGSLSQLRWESKHWEVRVPTTLTVLQCNSGCATGDGLPCDCGNGVGVGTHVPMVGTSIATPATPSGDPTVVGG